MKVIIACIETLIVHTHAQRQGEEEKKANLSSSFSHSLSHTHIRAIHSSSSIANKQSLMVDAWVYSIE